MVMTLIRPLHIVLVRKDELNRELGLLLKRVTMMNSQ